MKNALDNSMASNNSGSKMNDSLNANNIFISKKPTAAASYMT